MKSNFLVLVLRLTSGMIRGSPLTPLLLALAMPFTLQGQDYTYTTNNGEITITRYTGSGGEVNIPGMISGLPVTVIDGAFWNVTTLTSVTIPDSVTDIGGSAFSGCVSLTGVRIGNGVTNIGHSAFMLCNSLTNVIIPDSVTTIGGTAFFECTSLTNVTIGNSVTTIGAEAFWYCTNLISITIPDSVTRIRDDAFRSCRSLTSVKLSTNLTSIEFHVFTGCTSLTNITIPDSVTTISSFAFQYCRSLSTVTIGNGVSSIGTGAFSDCYSLTSVSIPNSLGGIGALAFSYCTSLANVSIPASVTDIGSGAFGACTNLIGVYFQGDAPSLGTFVFSDADNVIVYYLEGTTGWGPIYGGRPTMLWYPQVVITSHPESQTVLEGADVTFAVEAAGTEPLSYQWRKESVELFGETNSTFSLSNVQTNQAGNYAVVIANPWSSVTSSVAVLTVELLSQAKIRVIGTNGVSGVNVVVPIHMTATTNENALGFSLQYDPVVLSYQSATLGSGSTGGSLLPNTSQISNGRLGISVSLPTGNGYASGTQEMVKVSFLARPVTGLTMTLVDFDDQPTPRELVDVQAIVLPATYSGAAVQIAPGTYEADVAARPNGDHNVSIADWVQVGRFVAGLDQVTSQSEMLRADCAPIANRGNGNLTVTDWVQAGRYAAGLDPINIVDGPTAGYLQPAGLPPSADDSLRVLRVLNTNLWAGQAVTVCLQMDSLGNETALGTSLSFDSTALRFVSARLGTDATGSILNLNTNEAGRLGLVLSLPFGTTLATGARELVLVEFQVAPTTSGNISLTLNDAPVAREVSDAEANALPTAYENGVVGVTGLPMLNVARLNQTIKLSWPVVAAPFVLQTARSVGDWSDVIETLESNGETISVTLPLSDTREFFRLRKE